MNERDAVDSLKSAVFSSIWKPLASRSKFNLREGLITLLSVFEWRYLLTPIAGRLVGARRLGKDGRVQVAIAREWFVFGVRVARYVLEVHTKYLEEWRRDTEMVVVAGDWLVDKEESVAAG